MTCFLIQVVNAFKAGDVEKNGVIPARQLRNLLQNWGEGLSAREVCSDLFIYSNNKIGGITPPI